MHHIITCAEEQSAHDIDNHMDAGVETRCFVTISCEQRTKAIFGTVFRDHDSKEEHIENEDE